LKKPVSESILSINATLPIEKVTFFGINLVKRYLLILVLAKSGVIAVLLKRTIGIHSSMNSSNASHEFLKKKHSRHIP